MEKAELRVAVAKDVLASMRKYCAAPGTYIDPTHDALIAASKVADKGGKEVAQLLKKKCDVCAIGATFLSLVAIDNKYKFQVGNNLVGESFVYTPLGYQAKDRLRKVFSEEQLCLIESAFETVHFNDFYNLVQDKDLDDKVDRAVAFGEKYDDPDKRLRAIMRNIVKNEGTFIP